ncbi:MAG: AI-2E family transporter [Gemmatimonadales bacterium]
MTDASTRDTVSLALAGLLLIALVAGVREVLSPPVVFLLFGFTLWPLRARPGVITALLAGGALTLLWLLGRYGVFIGPFALAFVLAYLIAPAVERVEGWGLRRAWAIPAVLIPLVGVVVGLAVLAGPQVADQASAIVDKAPRLVATVLTWLDGVRAHLATWTLLSVRQRAWLAGLNADQLTLLLQQHASDILTMVGGWALGLARQVGTIFGIIGYLFITPVVLFHLLRAWPRIVAFLGDTIPPARREPIRRFVAEFDGSLGRYVRGALTEAVLIGVMTLVGLGLTDVPNALLLAVITGISTLIPYLGLVVAGVLSLVVALTMDDPASGLLRVTLVFTFVHIMDGSVMGPRIVGDSVGLHPVWIMIALALSGAFFGFIGLVIAVPLAVLVKMIGVRALARYKAGPAYAGASAP